MAGRKRQSSETPKKGPSVTASKAREKLQDALDRANALASSPTLDRDQFDKWKTLTSFWLEAAFGEDDPKIRQVLHAGSQRVWDMTAGQAEVRARYAEQLRASASQLEVMREILEHQAEAESDAAEASEVSMPKESKNADEESTSMSSLEGDPRKVFVIHGRNHKATHEMGIFLKSLGLQALNWDDLRGSMPGSPTTYEVIKKGMKDARGVIAMCTPDEYAVLRPQHRDKRDKGGVLERWQARPNVIFEAGMAFERDRDRVICVAIGPVDFFSDIDGIQTLRPTNDATGDRKVLRRNLKSMGCAVIDDDDDSSWMKHGDFESCVKELPEVLPSDPFRGS